MQDKLQELTDVLYNKGIEKAKSDSLLIIEQAQAEAKRIVAEAQNSALKLVEDAKQKAIQFNLDSLQTLNASAEDILIVLKNRISQLITINMTETKVNELFNDDNFLVELLKKILLENADDNYLIGISAKYDKALINIITQNLSQYNNKKMSLKIDNDISTGFYIINTEKNYRIDISNDSVMELIQKTVGERVYEVLFRK